jgi:hypothetical protein
MRKFNPDEIEGRKHLDAPLSLLGSGIIDFLHNGCSIDTWLW